jgi:hypothetical protein
MYKFTCQLCCNSILETEDFEIFVSYLLRVKPLCPLCLKKVNQILRWKRRGANIEELISNIQTGTTSEKKGGEGIGKGKNARRKTT